MLLCSIPFVRARLPLPPDGGRAHRPPRDGSAFYTPDISSTETRGWHEVFDSSAAVFSPKAQSSYSGQVANGGPNSQITEAGGCDGAAWVNVTPDDRFVFHSISGRYTNQDDFAVAGILPVNDTTSGYYKPHSMVFIENNAPLTGATMGADGKVNNWFGNDEDNQADSGGFPYAE